jgi:hypothetical protein
MVKHLAARFSVEPSNEPDTAGIMVARRRLVIPFHMFLSTDLLSGSTTQNFDYDHHQINSIKIS